jgi:hypothetical protein
MVYEHWCTNSDTLAQIRYRQTDEGKLMPITWTTDDAPFPPAKAIPELYALLPASLSKMLGEAHRRCGTINLHITLYPGHPEALKAFDLQAAGQYQHIPSPNFVRGITFYFEPAYMRPLTDQRDKWLSAFSDAKAIMKRYPNLGRVELRFCTSGYGTREWQLTRGNGAGLRMLAEQTLACISPLPTVPTVTTVTTVPRWHRRRRPKETWPETLKIFVCPHEEHVEILKCWKGELITVDEYRVNVQRAEQERVEQVRKEAADLVRRKEILEVTRRAMEERRQRELAMPSIKRV